MTAVCSRKRWIRGGRGRDRRRILRSWTPYGSRMEKAYPAVREGLHGEQARLWLRAFLPCVPPRMVERLNPRVAAEEPAVGSLLRWGVQFGLGRERRAPEPFFCACVGSPEGRKRACERWRCVDRVHSYSPEQAGGQITRFNEAGSKPGGERPIFTRWRRILRSSSGSVITARIRIGAEHGRQTNGSTSYT
jgi:hypothetical protein